MDLKKLQDEVIFEQLRQLKQQNIKEQINNSFNNKAKENLRYIFPWIKVAFIIYISFVFYDVYNYIQSGNFASQGGMPGSQIITNIYNWIKQHFSLNTLLAIPIFFVYALIAGVIYYEGENIAFFAVIGLVCSFFLFN